MGRLKVGLQQLVCRIVGAADELERRQLVSLLGQSTGSLALRVGFIGLGFALSILLARTMGAVQYGYYAYALTWINVLAVPASLGTDRLLVREVAVYRGSNRWAEIKGLLLRSSQGTLLASLFLMICLGAVVHFAVGGALRAAFFSCLAILPFAALSRARQSTMRGFGKVVLGQMPENLIQPALLIAVVAGTWLISRHSLTASETALMHLFTMVVAFLVGSIVVWLQMRVSARGLAPRYETRRWAACVVPLIALGAMGIINTRIDALMLGLLDDPGVVGVYRVACRGSDLITLALFAVNAALAPVAAHLFAAGQLARLQRTITRTARAILAFSLPVTLILIVFGRLLLSVYGEEFAAAVRTMRILSVGRFVSTAMGSVSLLLVMTNHESVATRVIALSVVANVALNALLIPRWGLEGAAVASAASMIVRNVVLSVLVHRRTGLHSTALAGLFRRGGRDNRGD